MAEEYGDLNEAFPIAQQVTINSFFLGTFIGLTDEKLQYIKESVDSFFEGLS
jgi:dTDP-4-amino-4,6-dideoxygalactose transaminase